MNALKKLVGCLLAALALFGCSSDRGSPPETETFASAGAAITPAPVYPLRIAASGRYLEDQSGVPFLWVGDSAWANAASLTPTEMDQYLDNRQAKGFTIAVVSLLEAKFSKNAPNDRAGHPPFTATLSPGVFDLTKPNDVYFATVEVFFQKAAARGMAVLVAHNYLGFQGGDEGWFSTLKANGATAVRQWGRYVGARYKNQGNIIWLSGGDYTPPDADKWVVDESAQGIRDGGANQLMTMHGARGEVSAAIWGSRSWYNLDSVYTGPPAAVPPLFRTEYARTPIRPTFLVEARYENLDDWTPAMLRYQAYQPYLTGGMGQMFGNDPIWHADGPGLGGAQPFTWQQALDQQGSQDMARLASVIGARSWWKLVPDNNHALLTAGFGSGLGEIVAARASDGSFALAYVPSTGTGTNTFTIAMSQFAGSVTAQWYNPTTGSFSTVPGSPFTASGSQNLTTPGNNGTSTNDWLLVLTASAAMPPPAPVLTTISVSPANASVATNAMQAFTATGLDQSGQPLSPQPAFSWSVSGGGSISSSGVFTAGGSSGGPFTVTASSGGKSGGASVTVTTAGAPTSLGAVADAYVRDGDFAATNFATDSQLLVKTDGPNWDRQTYVKFDVSSVTSISTAKLRLFGTVAAGEQVPVQLFNVADTSWAETSLVWNNKPAPGSSPLASATVSGSAGAWFEWDVSAYVKAEKAAGRNLVSFTLLNTAANTNPATFNPREAASNPPQLALSAAAGTQPNQAPTVATAAAANPNPVTGSTSNLSVLGADDGGEANLIYSWATTGNAPAPVSFNPSKGRSVTATFAKAGAYSIQSTITDAQGLSTTSSVNVTVNQTLSNVSVTPSSASVAPGGSQQFSAVGSDQFGFSLTTQPTFAWSVSGGGTISANGAFTAGNTAGGPFTVTASSGGKGGTASVTIVSGSSFTLHALADAYVRDGDFSATNFGLATDLEVKTDAPGWDRRTYLKFDLSSISGNLSNVKLRLFGSVPGGEQVPMNAYSVVDTSWGESSINWNNQPAAGSTALAFVTVLGATGTWYEWDLTAYVKAEKAAGHNLVSFVLLNPNSNTQLPTFASDEASSNRPELVLTIGG